MVFKVFASQYHPGLYYIQRWNKKRGDIKLDILYKDGTWSNILKMFTKNPKNATGYYPSKQEAEKCLSEVLTPKEWAEYIASKMLQ